MKSGALFVLAGSLALAGCSSSASGTAATPTAQAQHTQGPKSDPTTAAAVPTTTASRSTLPPTTTVAQGSAFDRGKADLAQGNYQDAETQFKSAISQGQHGATSYDGLGTAAIQLGDYMAAYRAYKAAIQIAPQNPAYIYKAAYSALYANDYRSSVAYATRYVQMRPKDASGYHLRLLAYGKLLLRPKQVSDAEIIVKLQPHSGYAYNDLGIALGNSGKYHASEQAFTQAIKLQPRIDEYYTNRAIVENLDRKPDLALQDLYRARSVTKNPKTREQIDLAVKNLKKHMRG